jgi:hypothetical protein
VKQDYHLSLCPNFRGHLCPSNVALDRKAITSSAVLSLTVVTMDQVGYDAPSFQQRQRNDMGRKQGWRRNEEEDEYRRTLLLHARKGDSKAKAELMEKFGMRVYSDTERSNMPTYYDSGRKGSPPSLTSTSNRKSIQTNSPGSQRTSKDRAQPKKRTKSTGKLKGKS